MAGVVAIILAGGLGRRFGADQPKQLQLLGGLPIIFHTLKRFGEVDEVDEVVIPAQNGWRSEIEKIAGSALHQKPFRVVEGGAERNLSVQAALRAVVGASASTKVLVHDGVRPLVTQDLIARVLKALDTSSAVLPVIPSIDLVAELRDGRAVDFLDRTRFLRGQTPQGFTWGLLSAAMEGLSAEVLASASTIYEVLQAHDPDVEIATVEGDESNIKITVPADRYLAGHFLLQRDVL